MVAQKPQLQHPNTGTLHVYQTLATSGDSYELYSQEKGEGQEDSTTWSFLFPVHFTSKIKTQLSATLNSNHCQRKQSDFDAIFKISGKDVEARRVPPPTEGSGLSGTTEPQVKSAVPRLSPENEALPKKNDY